MDLYLHFITASLGNGVGERLGLKCFFYIRQQFFLYLQYMASPVSGIFGHVQLYTSHIKNLSGTGGLDKKAIVMMI